MEWALVCKKQARRWKMRAANGCELLSQLSDGLTEFVTVTGVDMTMSPSEDLDVNTLNGSAAASSSVFTAVGSSIFLLAASSFAMLL